MDIYCTFLLVFTLNSVLFSFRVKLEHLSKTFLLFPCCWKERDKKKNHSFFSHTLVFNMFNFEVKNDQNTNLNGKSNLF